MKKNTIKDTTLEMAHKWGRAEYMEEGLVLTDCITNTLLPDESIRMNFITMALCCKGNATYTLDTREQKVKAGDLLFISERHIMGNYTASPDFECLSIMVSTKFSHGFVQNVKNVSALLLFSMNNPVVQLTAEEIRVFGNYYQTIRKKMENKSHHYRTELVKALLLAMFYDMSNVIWRVEQTTKKSHMRAEDLFSKFIQLLEKNFRTERRVSWYAQQLEITPKYLSEVSKRVSGYGANYWINRYTIIEIQRCLRHSNASLVEISDEFNFSSTAYFSRFVQNYLGTSPGAYRS